MPQTQHISRNNTRIIKDEGKVIVMLHSTPVVTIDYDTSIVTYNTGGWNTATTFTRMQQVNNEYNLPYSCGRAKGTPHATRRSDGTRFDFKGSVLSLPL